MVKINQNEGVLNVSSNGDGGKANGASQNQNYLNSIFNSGSGKVVINTEDVDGDGKSDYIDITWYNENDQEIKNIEDVDGDGNPDFVGVQ